MKFMGLWLWLLAVPGSENWLYAVLEEATDARLLGAEKTLDEADEACDATESRLPFCKRWSGMDELRRVRGIEPISVKRWSGSINPRACCAMNIPPARSILSQCESSRYEYVRSESRALLTSSGMVCCASAWVDEVTKSPTVWDEPMMRWFCT